MRGNGSRYRGDKEINRSNIINLMSIGGAQRVMLEVTVAEVQRSLIKRFDSSFGFFNKMETGELVPYLVYFGECSRGCI